ncbi:zinc-ribbon domain-containing protein [Nitrospina watsonii]|uniref:Znf/thioredoxin_put domain-containing protein n=1 Tax=Nitrospina watsonii TaxID=1323948 RepID=A0ABN8VUF1_9BACT|nr:zinc-ribbon domain-containing protein [Nitrospina watsonii]CAI2716886.1 Znf/thioredoxin_put domain-containing protein [Nitrospina watsonii]
MQVTCSQCSKAINIPDEKVPKDQAFNLTCPACKTKNRIDQHLKPEEPEEDDAMDTMLMVTDEAFEDEETPPIYEEGDKVALIMSPQNYDALGEALTALGYKLETSKTPEHGAHKLKFFHYHVVVFHERFGCDSLEESSLYKYVLNMPMSTRRKTFIALVGAEFKSTDNMEAFAYSVNQVINEKDMDKLDVILKKGISDNEIFYRIYRETMDVLGKV